MAFRAGDEADERRSTAAEEEPKAGGGIGGRVASPRRSLSPSPCTGSRGLAAEGRSLKIESSSADRMSRPNFYALRATTRLSEGAEAARASMAARRASDSALTEGRGRLRSSFSGGRGGLQGRQSLSEISLSYGMLPRVTIDKETEAAMVRRLSAPRKPPTYAATDDLRPSRLELRRSSVSGRLEEVCVPIPPVLPEEQTKSMVEMYHRAIDAEARRRRKLSDKYLSPLVNAKKISTLDDMVEHLLRLDKLHHGVSTQAPTIRG